MWLNCVFGGKGVGMINMLIFLIIGVFLAGLMVGRTPEYLGKKVGAREMKLAMIALLVHPLMILGPTGLFAATDWGTKAENNPGAHGFSRSSTSSRSRRPTTARLRRSGRYLRLQRQSQARRRTAVPWDIAHGPGDAVQPVSSDHRADRDGRRARTQEGRRRSRLGTLRDDTVTFGFVLFGHDR